MATGAMDAGIARRPATARRVWLERYAWFVTVYSVVVVLWGVVVRATDSGAGCGDHWPLCQGQVIPMHPQVATIIEYVHRLMSGPSEVPLILGLLIWVYRATPKGHLARAFAVAATALTFVEGLLGALLVKLGLTAMSTSPWRPPMLALHLCNTLLLLGALTLTAFFAGRQTAAMRGEIALRHKGAALTGLLAAMAIGVTGSLAALGDTLYPSTSLAQAFASDFSSSSQWLIRLRILHPVSALVAGGFVLWLTWRAVFARHDGEHRRLGLWLVGLFGLQLGLGLLDVLLKAPVWMQVLHLAGADAFWSVLVVLTAALTMRPKTATAD